MAKIDHAAIRTASYEDAQKFFEDVFEMHMWIKVYPVKEINDHWFSLPNGTKIELKLLENWKVNK